MTIKKEKLQSHKRINTGLLSKPEKAFIQWFLTWVPDWATPDLLTGIGFAGTIMIFAGYCLTLIDARFLWLANLGLLVNWFGDSTDGNLARHRHAERPRYGFFLDHSVDSIGLVLTYLGMGISPYIQLNLALLGLSSYLLLSIFIYLDTLVNETFQLSFAGLGPTEARLIILITNILMLVVGNVTFSLPFGVFTLFDGIMLILTLVMFIFFLTMTIKRLRDLAALEPEQKYRSKPKS